MARTRVYKFDQVAWPVMVVASGPVLPQLREVDDPTTVPVRTDDATDTRRDVVPMHD